MSQSTGWLSIRQVAEQVGVSTQLIRKWEQRYRVPEPRRLPNGYRVYSEQDVVRLLAVRELMERGYSVQNAMIAVANRDHAVASDRLTTSAARLSPAETVPKEPHGSYLAELRVAGAAADKERLLFTLQQAYHRIGLGPFSTHIVQPFLVEVGELWQSKAWSEYQEHIASSAILTFLQRLRTSLVEESRGPLSLCATVPYERHEITLQLLMIHALLNGWRIAYLGASPAPGAIEQAVSQLQPKLVMLSITTAHPLTQDPDLLKRLDAFAAHHLQTGFWLGCAAALAAQHPLDQTSYVRQATHTQELVGVLEQGSPYRTATP